MNYEPMVGECISETASKMVALATEHNCEVTASFNEIPLICNRLSSAGDIQQFYHDESQKRAKAYRESPEAKASDLEYAERERQKKSTLQGALSVAPPMAFKDEAAWQKSVDLNKDGYGSCVMRYAEKWGRLMQTRVANGETVAECAEETSHVADDEGITGFMHGCAVSILAATWIHGEELRRWRDKAKA